MHITIKEPPMTTDDNRTAPGAARTDDLLASSADARGGAQGFEAKATPDALQTGMEGIAPTGTQQVHQTDSQATPTNETVQDKPGQVRNSQE
jgi:hypothetical protein